MNDYTKFDVVMTEDEAFQLVAMAVNDNPIAKKVLAIIHCHYHNLMNENEELRDEIAELKVENKYC